jgi:DNA-directed RNA polymerase
MDRSLPTIIEPAPWIDFEIGGYYLRPTTIMRYAYSPDQ